MKIAIKILKFMLLPIYLVKVIMYDIPFKARKKAQ